MGNQSNYIRMQLIFMFFPISIQRNHNFLNFWFPFTAGVQRIILKEVVRCGKEGLRSINPISEAIFKRSIDLIQSKHKFLFLAERILLSAQIVNRLSLGLLYFRIVLIKLLLIGWSVIFYNFSWETNFFPSCFKYVLSYFGGFLFWQLIKSQPQFVWIYALIS